MATGVNYWSANERSYKVSERAWGDEHESSGEEGGGGAVTWEKQAMEVKGQVITAPDPFTCPDRKQRERMGELQERRRSLQALLSARLAELRRICLQEAELTGAVPCDFPLEAGEKLPCVRRRGGTSRHPNRKCRSEDEDSQRSKSRKTLFSGALRKHSDSEQNSLSQTHTHHGKRTVHRGCHTDDMVKSESSSTSDSTGHDNDEGVTQFRPLLATTGSPVEVFYHSKTRRNSLHNRNDHPENLPVHRPLPLPPPPLPPRSLESSSSSGPSDPGLARHSNSSDGLLDRIHHQGPKEEGGGAKPPGGAWLNGQGSGSRGTSTAGLFRSSETLANGRTKTTNGVPDVGGAGRGRGGVRGAGYSEVLLDYVWGKQQQQQQQQRQQCQTGSRQPITAQHQLLYNGYTNQQLAQGAPPTGRAHPASQRIKVTRTKSCGPFLPVQQSQSDGQPPPLGAIQPDPHPHLLPPRPPQQAPPLDSQLEEATRSLHKALALEGLRDWYLRNTVGSSHQSQPNGKVNTGVNVKANGGGVKGQAGVVGAAPARRRTLGAVQQSSFQAESGHHQAPPLQAPPHRKPTLPHSATFHGHPLHGRSMDGAPYAPQKQEVTLRDLNLEPPSPGTLV